MNAPLRILIIEDSEDDALLIVRDLQRAGYEPIYERVDTEAAVRAALDRGPWDVVVSDFSMPSFSGTDALKLLREHDQNTPFIFVSGTIGEDVAVQAMRAGAQDYVTKGNLRRLAPAIEREIREAAVRRERRAAEARFRRVVESAMIGILFWDPQGRITDANDQFLKIVGYTREDLEAGRIDWRAMTPAEYEAADAKALEEFAARGTCTPFEKEYIRKDGSRVPIIVGGALLHDAVHPAVAFIIDITERKQAEEARRATEERYHLLFERHPQPLWVFDRETLEFLEVNDAAVRHYGFSREEFLGMTIEAIRPPSELPALQAYLRRPHIGLHMAGVWRHRKKDGSIIDVEATAHDVVFLDRPARLVAAVDVTERRRAEEQLAERARLAELAAEIGTVLTRGTGLQEVLQGGCESLVRHLDAAFVRIWTHNELANTLELQASAGLYTHLDGAHSRVPVGQYKIGLIAAERRPHLTNAVIGDPRVHDQEWAKREGMVAFAGYPLLVQDRLVGVMAMFARHPFDAFVQQALGAVADSIAVGISRKQAEAAVMGSERRFRALIENSADAIALFAPDGTIVYASPATAVVLGYVPAELQGRNALELIHPDDLARIRPDLLAGLRGPASTVALEARVRHRDGSWRLCEGTFANLIRDRAVGAVVANYRDITERRRAEEALRARGHQQAAVAKLGEGAIETANLTSLFEAAVSLVSETLDVRYCSLLELQRDGKSLLLRAGVGWGQGLVGHATVLAENESQAGSTLQHNEPVVVEDLRSDTRFSGPDLLHSHGVVSGVTVKIPIKARPFGVLGAHTDTARTFTRDDIHFLQAIAHILGTAVDRDRADTASSLSQRLESVGRLAGGVAHDFNNLLTAITGYSELLLADLKAGDPMRSDLGEIHKAAMRAAALTRQLLAFSRRQVLEPKPLDLNVIIEDLEKMLHRLIGEDIELKSVLPSDLGTVRADPAQIEQVIVNLVVNARDAMPGGGRLTIETMNVDLDESYADQHVAVTPGRYVMLAVTDTGIGMDRDTQARIFEPFFTTKGPERGTGLGLATVYGIVKQSGGNIWVYSEPGHGTTFKIYLPRVLDDAVPVVPAERASASLRGSETVLLVEDDEIVRNLAERILRQAGYQVLVAHNGAEALLVSERHQAPIHLLISDVVMPQMGGGALSSRLGITRPDMRVLYVSGYTDPGIVQEGLLDGGAAFLQKPFTTEALTRKVRELLAART